MGFFFFSSFGFLVGLVEKFPFFKGVWLIWRLVGAEKIVSFFGLVEFLLGSFTRVQLQQMLLPCCSFFFLLFFILYLLSQLDVG